MSQPEVTVSELSVMLLLTEQTRDNCKQDVLRWHNREREARERKDEALRQLEKWDRVVEGLKLEAECLRR